VYAAAVILDPLRPIEGLRDSKQLSPARRQHMAVQIRAHALAWQVAWADVEEIDCLNILALRPSLVQVDGNRIPQIADCCDRVEAVVKGDSKIAAISAASILAKQARDALMPQLAQAYPGYQLDVHKGYPTPEHLAALLRLGPSPQHRRSFAPVRDATDSLWT
jgi:ribonuclease HII